MRTAFASVRLVLQGSVEEVRRLRDRVIPNAQQVYEALSEGYKRGRFGLLDLLEARRSLAATRLRYLDALVRLNGAKADMDRLLPADPNPIDGETP